jgi:hypothetical protein
MCCKQALTKPKVSEYNRDGNLGWDGNVGI